MPKRSDLEKRLLLLEKQLRAANQKILKQESEIKVLKQQTFRKINFATGVPKSINYKTAQTAVSPSFPSRQPLNTGSDIKGDKELTKPYFHASEKINVRTGERKYYLHGEKTGTGYGEKDKSPKTATRISKRDFHRYSQLIKKGKAFGKIEVDVKGEKRLRKLEKEWGVKPKTGPYDKHAKNTVKQIKQLGNELKQIRTDAKAGTGTHKTGRMAEIRKQRLLYTYRSAKYKEKLLQKRKLEQVTRFQDPSSAEKLDKLRKKTKDIVRYKIYKKVKERLNDQGTLVSKKELTRLKRSYLAGYEEAMKKNRAALDKEFEKDLKKYHKSLGTKMRTKKYKEQLKKQEFYLIGDERTNEVYLKQMPVSEFW